jgi:AcrR family transcriptional regulator
MPKDKSTTNAKILACMRDEFLTYGYEKSSLNRISKNVGITTAGLYKHFDGKEEMFGFLVKDTLDDLEHLKNTELEDVVSGVDPFGDEWIKQLVDFIYDHFEGMKLLICYSTGSRYESFEEDLIRSEEESNKQYAQLLKNSGHNVKVLTDMQWHLLSTEYVHLLFEMVRHDLSKDDAMKHMEFVKFLLYPGWKEIFGI